MEESTKSILVTGGGGFLGQAIVRLLLQKGHRVASFSRGSYPELDAIGVEQHTGDLADADAVKKAVDGKDVVFHTAAKAGVWGPFDNFFRPNVAGTRNVIAACRACGVGRLIYTSSPSVVFDGTDMEGVNETVPYPADFHAPYPRTKAMAEQEVMAAADEKLKTLSLRPHLIWGPGDPHLAPRIIARAKSLRQVGDGGNRVDTIYIDNAALAHVLAMEALEKKPEISGKAYFISDDAPILLWEMVNRILDAGGKPPVKRKISPKAAFFIGSLLEWIYRAFGLKGEPKMTRFVARELATSHWFDISAAKRDFGYTAEVSIDDGMRRLKAWLAESSLPRE
ncbi:NAD-dependent epimerase/dehydratase family protein [uncultured Desulfosarcina sp.]|uniref:NAD-dependent epimerase/dehydratase family protein n=1 Tax=uncultured Desulfosarcina sp. TaxID=218289 RepID=UPI0029C7586F|nr:NAD-dependent epimerase/dehydratase family protein [uncultured Desulfosarcina sp.]